MRLFWAKILCWAPPSLILAEMLVLADAAGAGGMASPASTRISAWMKCVQGHVSPREYEPRHLPAAAPGVCGRAVLET